MLKKRIPTIVGLLLLLIGAFAGVMFINQNTDFLPRAAPEYAPQKVKITNLTDTGFTVSWVTQEPTIGFIKYGETTSNLNITATDDRDQLTGASGEYRSHYISIQDLKPSKTYHFKLGSQKNQLYDNNGQAFTITTPPALSTLPTADTAYGTVVTTANTPAEGAIVYLSLEGTTPISALVKQNGNWAANMALTRTIDLSSYATYDPQNARIDILVQPASGDIAKVITTTGNDQPVPTITLGQVADYSTQNTSLNQTTNETANQTPSNPLTITSIQDGAVVSEVQPEFSGTAKPNSLITISVHSEQEYTGQVTVDENGNWTWMPSGELEPGQHTITISYTDENGVEHKVERNFIVEPPAEAIDLNQLTYTATPSATPVPTPTPTPRPTATPTPRTTTVVASSSGTIQAGGTFPTIMMLMFGIGSVGFGIWFSKKQSI